MTAREASLKALAACRKSGAWPDTFLRHLLDKEKMDKREAALTSKITYGVLQNLTLLDFYINEYSTVKTVKLEPMLLDILRLSGYQLVFLTKIPVSAAVDEGVKLAKKYSNKRAARLVNAVLRRISENRGKLPEPPIDDFINYLSIKYSHPIWLVGQFTEILGYNGAEELLKSNNQEIPVTAQINTLKTNTETVLIQLENDNIKAERHPWLSDCIEIEKMGDISKLTCFREGLIYIQDAAARMAVLAAAMEPGCRLLDCCAAPGGKSFASAIEMGNTGEIVSCDIHEKKLGLIQNGAYRLGISNIKAITADAKIRCEEFINAFDVVIADVPCSGTGVIRKKPEIRQKDEKDILALPDIQRNILKNVSEYVKPGGILIYSTCTLLPRENEDIFTDFLTENTSFTAEEFLLPSGGSKNGMITLYPHIHGTDGFFIGKMRRQ